jgi:hypothetical protein
VLELSKELELAQLASLRMHSEGWRLHLPAVPAGRSWRTGRSSLSGTRLLRPAAARGSWPLRCLAAARPKVRSRCWVLWWCRVVDPRPASTAPGCSTGAAIWGRLSCGCRCRSWRCAGANAPLAVHHPSDSVARLRMLLTGPTTCELHCAPRVADAARRRTHSICSPPSTSSSWHFRQWR